MKQPPRSFSAPWVPAVSVGLWTVAVASLVIVGADTLWAVAQGGQVLRTGSSTPPLTYTASSPGWEAPLALGWVVMSLADRAGPWGLSVLQVVITASTLTWTAREALRWGTRSARTAFVVSLAAVGSATSLVVARLPMLSLLPFVALAGLLRREHQSPSGRIWGAVVLLALWANLHGGVIVGWALLGVHLLCSRARTRPLEAALVGGAATLAICATPIGWRTAPYFRDVFGNAAAARHTDLWARPNVEHPLDIAMIVVGLALLAWFARSRPPLWEAVVSVGLVIGTAQVARNGTWLVLFLAPVAFAAQRDRVRLPWSRSWVVVLAAVAPVSALILGARGTDAHPVGDEQVPRMAVLAAGRTVLADEPVAETLSARGVRVWAANPIDAFPLSVQEGLLDFLHGGGTTGVPRDVTVVVVTVGGQAADGIAGESGWRRLERVGAFDILERSS